MAELRPQFFLKTSGLALEGFLFCRALKPRIWWILLIKRFVVCTSPSPQSGFQVVCQGQVIGIDVPNFTTCLPERKTMIIWHQFKNFDHAYLDDYGAGFAPTINPLSPTVTPIR